MTFLSYLISGISLGSIYAIIALGYTMVYGIAKMLNFCPWRCHHGWRLHVLYGNDPFRLVAFFVRLIRDGRLYGARHSH